MLMEIRRLVINDQNYFFLIFFFDKYYNSVPKICPLPDRLSFFVKFPRIFSQIFSLHLVKIFFCYGRLFRSKARFKLLNTNLSCINSFLQMPHLSFSDIEIQNHCISVTIFIFNFLFLFSDQIIHFDWTKADTKKGCLLCRLVW
jgi:hypothetical protein